MYNLKETWKVMCSYWGWEIKNTRRKKNQSDRVHDQKCENGRIWNGIYPWGWGGQTQKIFPIIHDIESNVRQLFSNKGWA